MFMKTQFLNEKFNYQNIIFATGTPVSNTLSELYTMTMYLRPDLLEKADIKNFDDWASTFAEVTVEMAEAASGGMKPKKSLSNFANLPELMRIFHTFADVKNAEDLNLPIPELDTAPRKPLLKTNHQELIFLL
jgi:N12 class adenine-specific DNA methylase